MKQNPYTPVYCTPRISDNLFPVVHLHGIEEMLNIEIAWLLQDRATQNRLGYYDTDIAVMLHRHIMHDLDFIITDLTVYSYIMEGWC